MSASSDREISERLVHTAAAGIKVAYGPATKRAAKLSTAAVLRELDCILSQLAEEGEGTHQEFGYYEAGARCRTWAEEIEGDR